MYVASIVLAALLQAPSAQPAADTKSDPDQEMVCRRIAVTGSLVRKERVCKTQGEWRRLADRGNAVAREIVDWGRGRPSGQ